MHNSWSFAPSVNRRCFKTSVLRATWRAKFAHVSSSRVFLAHVGFKIRLLRTRTQLGAQLERRRSVGGAIVWHLRLTPDGLSRCLNCQRTSASRMIRMVYV